MDHEKDLQILKHTFPNVTCYCELCDCGRHRHHKDCLKARRKQSPNKFPPKTHYQVTYTGHRDVKPSSSKRPQASYQLVLRPPLDGNSIQREHYKPIDVEKYGRPPAYNQALDYEKPKVPFDHISTHKAVFVPQPIDALDRAPAKGSTIRFSGDQKFQNMTTNREFYKSWDLDASKVVFSEPPSFLGSVLFPSNRLEEKQSVTRRAYPGIVTKKVEPTKIPPGNLHIGEGGFDHTTVNRDVYQGLPGIRSDIVIHEPELGKNQRNSFYGESQSKRDYRPYGPNAGRQCLAIPAPDTLDLKFNNKHVMETEQRATYRGHDTTVHCAPSLAKKDNLEYKKPEVPFETKTCNKIDYIPPNLDDVSQDRARMPVSKMIHGGKFHDQTSYKEYFKGWESPRPPQRYGDFLDGINSMYLPSFKKFTATTTHHDQFTPKQAEIRENMKPKSDPMAQQGKQDFETVHRLTYKGDKPPLCKAEAYLLQQELKRRLAEEGIEGSHLAQSLRPSAVCAK